jgi:SAM-dependent methyltransferase
LNYDNALMLENKRLNRLLINYPGRHLLQISEYTLPSLAASPIPHKIQISQIPLTKLQPSKCSFLQSAYTHLPFANDSINLILLHHILEFNKNAKLILSEAWRVLIPQGHLILIGINPLSLWGLYRLFESNKKLPWNSYFYTIQTLCQWIHHLGGEICHTESFLFRPPLNSKIGRWLFAKLAWLEKLSPWVFPYLGGIYLIIAQKQVKQLNSLGLLWQFAPVLNNKVLAPNTRGVHCAF